MIRIITTKRLRQLERCEKAIKVNSESGKSESSDRIEWLESENKMLSEALRVLKSLLLRRGREYNRLLEDYEKIRAKED